jgi:tetratricopeptide (TPR) repeat protein
MGDAKMTEIGGAGKAVSYYEAAMELDPKNPIPSFKIGDIYYSARNYDEALLSFQKSIQIDSTFIPVYRELGLLYADMKRLEEAKSTFGHYVELADQNPATNMRYAQFLYLTKDFKSTINLIDQILKIDSTNWKMYRLLGFSSFEQGDYAKAVSSIQKVMTMAEPSKLIASDFEKLGKSYAKLRNEENAVTNLNKAIAMDSTNYELHFDLGDVYYSSKKYAQAATEYAIKINAKGGKAVEFNQLGLTQIKAKNYLAGDSAYAHLVELKPKSHLGFIGRARCASFIDSTMKSGQAVPFYENVITIVTADSAQVIKYKTDLIETYNYLGTYYVQNENNEKAKLYFSKLLEIDPENKNAKTVLGRK